MNHKGLLITGIILFFISTASAIEVVDYDPQIPIDDLSQAEQSRYLELVNKVATLENKIGTLASKEDMEAQTAFIVNYLVEFFTNKTDIILLASAILNVFALLLAFALYFYLKGNGRV